jgi:hypothetical protein
LRIRETSPRINIGLDTGEVKTNNNMLSLVWSRRRSWLLALALLAAIIVGMAIQRYAPGFGHAGASDARGDTPIRVVGVKWESGSIEVGVQADAIRQCVADGAFAIAATMAAPEAVGAYVHLGLGDRRG